MPAMQRWMFVFAFVALLDIIIVRKSIVGACYLHGTDSGECTTMSEDIGWLEENMPYCQIPMRVAPAKPFPVCIPKYQVIGVGFVCNFCDRWTFIGLTVMNP